VLAVVENEFDKIRGPWSPSMDKPKVASAAVGSSLTTWPLDFLQTVSPRFAAKAGFGSGGRGGSCFGCCSVRAPPAAASAAGEPERMLQN
jgi:hypothetical protein